MPLACSCLLHGSLPLCPTLYHILPLSATNSCLYGAARYSMPFSLASSPYSSLLFHPSLKRAPCSALLLPPSLCPQTNIYSKHIWTLNNTLNIDVAGRRAVVSAINDNGVCGWDDGRWWITCTEPVGASVNVVESSRVTALSFGFCQDLVFGCGRRVVEGRRDMPWAV